MEPTMNSVLTTSETIWHTPQMIWFNPKHHYAIVDEVDSVLIDDARTPLIISGPTPEGDRHEFDLLKPKVSALVSQQRSYLTGVLAEAKKKIAEGDTQRRWVFVTKSF